MEENLKRSQRTTTCERMYVKIKNWMACSIDILIHFLNFVTSLGWIYGNFEKRFLISLSISYRELLCKITAFLRLAYKINQWLNKLTLIRDNIIFFNGSGAHFWKNPITLVSEYENLCKYKGMFIICTFRFWVPSIDVVPSMIALIIY